MLNASSDRPGEGGESNEQPVVPSPPVASGFHKVPWSLWGGVVFVVVVFFAAQLLAGLLVSLYPLIRQWSAAHTNDWFNHAVTAQFSYVVLAEAISLALVYAWLRRYRERFAAIGLKRPRLGDIGYGLLAVVPYYVAYALLLAAVLHLVPSLNVDQKQEIGFDNVQGSLALLLTFVSVVVVVPITEEIMVRGFLYGSLRKALPVLRATLLTSVIFAAAHLPEGGAAGPLWVGAIDTFVLSLALCYLREKDRKSVV